MTTVTRDLGSSTDDTGPLDELKRLLKRAAGSLSGRKQTQFAADQFATWLPYEAYLADERLFINSKGVGFMLEVLPQSGAEERMVEILMSLYANCPTGTGIQFHLFASPHISEALRAYANLRVEDADQLEQSQHYGRPARNSNLFRTLARERYAYLEQGSRESLTRGSHFTVREFRLMLSVTVPADGDDRAKLESILQLRDGMAQTLMSASFPNRVCSAKDLINWVSMFVNPDRMDRSNAPDVNYDDGRELRDQVVDHDTIQDEVPGGLTLWKEGNDQRMSVRFFSIKSFPERYELWGMGSLIGDLMQPALQYHCPFLLTMGVMILDPNATRTLVTSNHVRATQNAESQMAKIMPDVAKKHADWRAAADMVDAGGMLVSLYHSLALFDDPAKAVQSTEAARAIWRGRGFELNAQMYVQRQALISSLPMTLSPTFHADLRSFRLVTRKTVANAVHLAPLVAEWRGTKSKTMVTTGRRGQLAFLDLYDNSLGNYNAAVIGAPGSGKSVLLNDIAVSYLAVGAKVFMLDLGRSFEKLCVKAGGDHLEFKPESRICLNPFSIVPDERIGPDGPEGGIRDSIDMLRPALAKICSMEGRLDDVQIAALETMVMRVFKAHGQEMTITALRDSLVDGTIRDLGLVNDQRIKDLAVMLNNYSRDGAYGRFFEGRNTVNFDNDLIVIENEELKRMPQLHAIVNILLMYQITGMMYLTRDRKKLLVIDELKQQLGDIGADDPTKAAVVEEAARRARKYGGALITATHSAEDYYGSAQMAAALACSDWTFLLRQKAESIDMLASQGRLPMDQGKRRLLHSLRMDPDAYSEFYVASPMGEGVLRLVLDPFTRLLFSNRLEDNTAIDQYRSGGMSVDQAILAVMRDRGVPLPGRRLMQ